MPMQVESLEVLEKADVAPAQARAIVRAIEIEIAGAKDTLATKQDLAPLAHDIGVLKQDVALLKQDVDVLKQDVAALKQDVATLRQELRHGLEISRKENSELGAKLRGELRAEIHASVSGVTRQMYLAILGQMGGLLGFAYFFATHLR
jgi:polyhydroxyalkanoate synthesis regulator phasin